MAVKGSKTYTYIKNQDRPAIRFRIKAALLIMVAVYIMCFAIYMAEANLTSKKLNSQGFSADTSVLSDVQTTEAVTNKEKKDRIINPVPASTPLTETYFGKCAFVGDSIMVGLSDYQLVPMKNVFAEIGMNIEKINTETMKTPYGQMTAINALKKAKPENVYIMLGSNGISWLSADEMVDYYSKFIDEIKSSIPDTTIYILSVPPVTAQREKAQTDAILNSNIDSYNSKLLKLADEKEIYFVDINTALKGNDGKFPENMAADDGMHFVKTTYSVVLDYILSHTAEQD